MAGTPAEGVDAHVIQPFYTGMLARASGMTLSLTTEGDRVTLIAEKA